MSSDAYQPFVMPDLAKPSPSVTGCHQRVAALSPPENGFPDWGKGADFRDFERKRAKTVTNVTTVTTFSRGLPWDEGLNALFALPAPEFLRVERWTQMLFDCQRFYQDWGLRAVELGWSETDLFGCNPPPSFKRLDNDGLVISLQGRRIIAMDAKSAKIDAGRGDTLTYYNSFPLENSVPLWIGFAMECGP